jgi:hypothetical protein
MDRYIEEFDEVLRVRRQSASEMFSSRKSRITHSVLTEKPVSFAAVQASLRGERTAERRPGHES